MKKLSFYLDNRNLPSIECPLLSDGNPGIGGTEYQVLVISYLLSTRNNDLSVELLVTNPDSISGFPHIQKVSGIEQAIIEAEESDYLVFCHDSKYCQQKCLSSQKVRLVPWCHNFPSITELDYYSENDSIWKVVCVGKEQMELFIDHPVYRKMEYVFNCVKTPSKMPDVPNGKRNHIVAYMGCIWPRKGFHWLAEAWPEVVSRVPDAELYVIGSGKLYGWQMEMGPFNLTERKYENLLMKYLAPDGNLLSGVHLMGIMGEEKNDILMKAKVGVPNPSGNTETFCITAVEMQMMGAYSIMGRCPGSLDTVKYGKLIRRKTQLAGEIVKALTRDNSSNENACRFFSLNFSFDAALSRWERLFVEETLLPEPIRNRMYRYKWLKLLMRRLKLCFPFLFRLLPPVERGLLAFERRVPTSRASYDYKPLF